MVSVCYSTLNSIFLSKKALILTSSTVSRQIYSKKVCSEWDQFGDQSAPSAKY